MKNATTATSITTYDLPDPEMQLFRTAGQTARSPQQASANRTLYPVPAANGAGNQTMFQVKEDKAFYVPDFLTDKHYDDNPEAHAAAEASARHLRKAECLLDEALNLVKLMLGSFSEEADSRAMQTETALNVIEEKLNRAYTCMDKHDTHHTNLFLAYADLKGKADGGKE